MRHYNLHTLPTSQSATLVFVPSSSGKLTTYYANSVLSSLPMSDLVLFSISPAPESIFPEPQQSSSQTQGYEAKPPRNKIRTLPINPYPAPEGTLTRLPLVSFPGHKASSSPSAGASGQQENFATLKPDTQETLEISSNRLAERKWVKGEVLGYRDRAGREAQVDIVWNFGLSPRSRTLFSTCSHSQEHTTP